MNVDNSKLNYLSTWDIDQLIAQGLVSVISTGNTTLYNITDSTNPSVFEVLFQPTGYNEWYQAGTSSLDGTIANLFTFYTYISEVSLIINTTNTGTARYYIWSDKINY